MRLLVIGGSGLVGSKIIALADQRFDVYATYWIHPFGSSLCKAFPLDVTQRSKVHKAVEEVKPECVILTSAMTNVDSCEERPDQALRINSLGPSYVAEACERVQARLVYISTDYVFDGTKDASYNEVDKPNPLSVYGRSKLEGERYTYQLCTNSVIARASVIYGWLPSREVGIRTDVVKPLNFAMWTLTKLKNGERIRVVNDQRSTPTLADSLAEALLILAGRREGGLYHISGKTCMSRFLFAKEIARAFDFDESLVESVSTSQLGLKASRPRNSCLDVSKAESELGAKLLHVDEGLKRMRRQVEEGETS